MANYANNDIYSVLVATTSVVDPILFLEVDGIIYPGGYEQRWSQAFRRIFASYDSNNNGIYLNAYAVAQGTTIPEQSFSTIKIHVAQNG